MISAGTTRMHSCRDNCIFAQEGKTAYNTYRHIFISLPILHHMQFLFRYAFFLVSALKPALLFLIQDILRPGNGTGSPLVRSLAFTFVRSFFRSFGRLCHPLVCPLSISFENCVSTFFLQGVLNQPSKIFVAFNQPKKAAL